MSRGPVNTDWKNRSSTSSGSSAFFSGSSAPVASTSACVETFVSSPASSLNSPGTSDAEFRRERGCRRPAKGIDRLFRNEVFARRVRYGRPQLRPSQLTTTLLSNGNILRYQAWSLFADSWAAAVCSVVRLLLRVCFVPIQMKRSEKEDDYKEDSKTIFFKEVFFIEIPKSKVRRKADN